MHITWPSKFRCCEYKDLHYIRYLYKTIHIFAIILKICILYIYDHIHPIQDMTVCIIFGIWNRDIFGFAFTAFIFAASCACNFFETSKGIEICKIFAIYFNVKRAKTLSVVMCAMCTHMYVCVVGFCVGVPIRSSYI